MIEQKKYQYLPDFYPSTLAGGHFVVIQRGSDSAGKTFCLHQARQRLLPKVLAGGKVIGTD